MANHTGASGLVTVAGATVAELVDMSWDEGCEIIDDSELTDTADTHKSGSTNWSGSITCHWDETDASGQEAMTIGASLALVWKPEGATTGDATYTGTATIESIGIAVTRNAIISRTFGVKGTGALTIGTHA